MNWAHVHLLINHIPVLGVGFDIILLLIAMARRNDEFKKVSLAIFAALAVFTVLVFMTGSPAAKEIRNLPGVSVAIIHRHSNAALVSTIALGILGFLSLGALVLYRRECALPVRAVWSLLVLALVVQGLMAWTANLGGQIRHTEIRPAVSGRHPASAKG
ncbi:MAG TPA: hypothetical protein VKV79_06470 [Terriglobia bacterium]|nr:hypothetical protein [Terriglobia bacterium]